MMHKQNLTALERELIDRLMSLDKADGIIESITEQVCQSSDSSMKEASAREDALVDEVVKWRRLALAWRRMACYIASDEDHQIADNAILLSDHIKLVEGGE